MHAEYIQTNTHICIDFKGVEHMQKEVKEFSKLYVYPFKSARHYLKRVVKMTPHPAMDRVEYEKLKDLAKMLLLSQPFESHLVFHSTLVLVSVIEYWLNTSLCAMLCYITCTSVS